VNNRFLKYVLALLSLCFHCAAVGVVRANELDGAWELTSYTLNGDDVDVSGILVLSNGKFGMIYSMGTEPMYARAHAGVYEALPHGLIFDARLWIQHVEGSSGIIPEKKVRIDLEWRKDSLVVHFEGGSSQELRRVEADQAELASGGWKLASAGGDASADGMRGFFVAAENCFVLMRTDDAAGAGRAYGGTVAPGRGILDTEWKVSVDAADGAAEAGEIPDDLQLELTDETLVIRDETGPSLTFEQW
jgi:hypothetical protein